MLREAKGRDGAIVSPKNFAMTAELTVDGLFTSKRTQYTIWA
jgi:hypothetical protein